MFDIDRIGVWRVPAVTIQALQEAAIAKGGECLSTSYAKSRGPLLMRCAAGHEWTSTANRLRRGHWCPACAKAANSQGLGLEPYRELAESKGGRCLTTTYAGANAKMAWQCAKGHVWAATGANVRVNGTWCPQCAARSAAVDLSAHQAAAASRGGACLSSNYKNAKTKMEWECALGHRWLATGGHVRAGTWCPTCANMAPKRRGAAPTFADENHLGDESLDLNQRS